MSPGSVGPGTSQSAGLGDSQSTGSIHRRVLGSVTRWVPGSETRRAPRLDTSQVSELGDSLGTGFPIPPGRAECLTLHGHRDNAPQTTYPYKSDSGVTA